jgi:redox-sensitive bicupin YhaK (pirin superfamily)
MRETDSSILSLRPLGFPWQPADPFLFCVHHDDRYPRANENFGPDASLEGRQHGMDFEGKDGWRMYHGDEVPGFPQHPHRGFETVTIVRRGLIDHSDSLGAAARYGHGDVQWLTAGKGILHSEMFPLLDRGNPNPVELFQIWLNLPRADKLVEPHFTMFWAEQIPRVVEGGAEITIVAGAYKDSKGLPPPPHSWAARKDTDVAIWTLRLQPGAEWTLPKTASTTQRALFFFRGKSLSVDGQSIPSSQQIALRPDREVKLIAGDDESEILLLQGRPIGQPVVQYGPFVMTSREEIAQTIAEFRQTGFGSWDWKSNEPVHSREEGRFARHADGSIERP